MSALIIAQNISRSIAGKPLFRSLNIGVEERERIAILGANGSGKSTLLKMFAKLDSPDDGNIIARRDLKVAYVAQQDSFEEGATIESVLTSVLDYNDTNFKAKLSKYIGKFEFADRNQKVDSLSGGWKKRLALARGCIQEADLVLLDEPTNHLDIASIEWLEDFISELPTTIVFVSHDRFFIESLATRVLELDKRYPEGVISNKGGYADFLDYRESYFSQLQKNYDVLNNKVRREVAWLRQGAKARTTKSKHRTAEALSIISELSKINLQSQNSQFEFSAANKRSKELLKLEAVSKSLGGRELFRDFSVVVSPGTRLGIAGDNGSGKSTLLNILTGKLAADRGDVTISKNTQISFFEQSRESLNPQMSLEEALMGDARSIVVAGREYVSSAWAKKFLFSVDQLSTHVGKLSGGEQARVMIARIIRSPADVLVLDEPTNDLDIQTLEVLEQSLSEFPGAVILVTHDRFLLDRVSTAIAGIMGDGRIELFASYLQWEIAKEAAAKEKTLNQKAGLQSNSKILSASDRQELTKLPDKIEKAEKQVASLEDKIAQIDANLNLDLFNKVCLELANAQKKVEDLYQRWGELEP
jgi:ATP-binding cassette subfamily F protein uup